MGIQWFLCNVTLVFSPGRLAQPFSHLLFTRSPRSPTVHPLALFRAVLLGATSLRPRPASSRPLVVYYSTRRLEVNSPFLSAMKEIVAILLLCRRKGVTFRSSFNPINGEIDPAIRFTWIVFLLFAGFYEPNSDALVAVIQILYVRFVVIDLLVSTFVLVKVLNTKGERVLTQCRNIEWFILSAAPCLTQAWPAVSVTADGITVGKG